MKNGKIKLLIMFLAGMLISSISVFALKITIPSEFNNMVQQLQKIVLTSASGVTGVILDGSDGKIIATTICNLNGEGCKNIAELSTGAGLDTGSVKSEHIANGQILSGHIANGQILSGHIASGQILSGHIANGAITQSKVTNGYVDLEGDQSINGNKTFWDNINIASKDEKNKMLNLSADSGGFKIKSISMADKNGKHLPIKFLFGYKELLTMDLDGNIGNITIYGKMKLINVNTPKECDDGEIIYNKDGKGGSYLYICEDDKREIIWHNSPKP